MACVCTVPMISASEGGRMSFQCRRMTSLVAIRICSITVLCEMGNISAPMDRIARPGHSTEQVGSKLTSKSPTCDHTGLIFGQPHSMWINVPLSPHCLQHPGAALGNILDRRWGVRYQRRSSFCCISSRLVLLVEDS